MSCHYCRGESPSSDGRTKCGWCTDQMYISAYCAAKKHGLCRGEYHDEVCVCACHGGLIT